MSEMRVISILVLCALLMVFTGCVTVAGPAPTPSTIITDVTVIDVASGAVRPHQSVILRDGRIADVGAASAIRMPRGAETVSGGGRFLVPGLWNMHVHGVNYEQAKAAFPALLNAGITGIRDMGSPPDDILRLRNEVRSGETMGPQMVVAGPLVQGPLPFENPMIVQVREPAEAAQVVGSLRSQGVDFIKVHDAITEEIYRAVARAARQQGLSFVGHVPPTVSARVAAELGQRSIEHLGGQFDGVMVAASSDEAALLQQTRSFYAAGIAALEHQQAPPFDNLRAPFIRRLLTTFNERKLDELIDLFRAHGTWQCPTLVALTSLWSTHESELTDDDRNAAAQLLQQDDRIVLRMAQAGIGLLAGTDGNYADAGPALHDELAKLVEAGLTPLQALQSATINPARFLGRSDLGTIERGKRADLVLLDRNPLVDIRNSRSVSMVFVNGRVWHAPSR